MPEGTAKPHTMFDRLLSKDVSKQVEKKGKFSYLSWAYAVAELGRECPTAEVEVIHFPLPDAAYMSAPFCMTPAGVFVEVAVTVEGVKRVCVHPVLDERNQTIKEPNAFDINRSLQRALTKAIALHGLGLNLYAGEDLPLGDDGEDEPKKKAAPKQSTGGVTIVGDLVKAIGAELDRIAAVGSERKRLVIQYAAPDAADSVAGMTRALDKLKQQ